MKNLPTALQRFESFRTSRIWFAAADILAMLLAVLLPWSTSAYLILITPLLAIICGSVDVPMFMRSIRRPASIVSLAFFALAAAGAFWSEAGVAAGLQALGPLIKFLVLPFLLYYFEKPRAVAGLLERFCSPASCSSCIRGSLYLSRPWR